MNCEHILDKSKFNKYYTLRKEIAPKGSFLDQLKCNEISVSTPCHSVGLPLLHLGPSACTCFAASPHASWKSISRFEGGVAPVARRWSPPNELAGSSSPSSLDCSSCCAGLFLIFLFFSSAAGLFSICFFPLPAHVVSPPPPPFLFFSLSLSAPLLFFPLSLSAPLSVFSAGESKPHCYPVEWVGRSAAQREWGARWRASSADPLGTLDPLKKLDVPPPPIYQHHPLKCVKMLATNCILIPIYSDCIT
jgi:hypothetical protein